MGASIGGLDMRAINLLAVAIASASMLAACDRQVDVEPPPRSTDKAPSPSQKSLIAVPINADTAALKQALERAVPKTLWTINRRERACVKPQEVKLFGKEVKVTPPIACTIVGRVTRGPLRLRGVGDEIIVDVPLNATIAATGVPAGQRGSAMAGPRRRGSISWASASPLPTRPMRS
jgi:hypothetical protein